MPLGANGSWKPGDRRCRRARGVGHGTPPPATVVGRAAGACARLGVDVLKRSTGGGSVLETCGVLNYSLVTPAPASLDPKACFRPGIELICAILAGFGVTGKPEGTSDVALECRKIPGNAQARRWKAVLVHGTLLVDFDHELAAAVLKHPPREPAYRRKRNHREFLVTLRSLGVKEDRAGIEQIARRAARQVFGPVREDNDETPCKPPAAAPRADE